MKTTITPKKEAIVTREQFDQWIKDEYTKSNISQLLFEHTTDRFYPDQLDSESQLPEIFGYLFASESFVKKNGKVSESVKKDYQKYDFLRHGAWTARVSDLNGKESTYTQIKPIKPRQYTDSKGKKKLIKYESLPDYQTKDYHCIALITDKNILEDIIFNICRNYDINYQDIDNSQINSYLDLIIYFGKNYGIIPRLTEGPKKHLADIEAGHLSIMSN